MLGFFIFYKKRKLKITVGLLFTFVMVLSTYITVEVIMNDLNVPSEENIIINDDNYATIDQWIEPPVCGGLSDHVKGRSDFPHQPSLTRKLKGLLATTEIEDSGQRIFGYIVPPFTDHYTLAISSSGNSEFWLSTNSHFANAKLIAWIGQGAQSLKGRMDIFDDYTSQQSHQIYLQAQHRYFFDIIHSHGVGINGFVQGSWKCSKCGPGWVTIASKYLRSMAIQNTSNLLSHAIRFEPKNLALPHIDALRDNFTMYPSLDQSLLTGIFESCPYRPSYIGKKIRKISSGLQYAYYTAVYPDDSTTAHGLDGRQLKGNLVFRRHAAVKITKMYMDGIRRKFGSSYRQYRLVNLEEKYDSINGHRYLIDLLILSVINQKIFRLSQYIYLPKGSNKLCLPQKMIWKDNVDVHFLITVKNQAHWMKYFIDRMSQIYMLTKDEHFTLTFVDFKSTDFNVEAYLRSSQLKRFKVINLNSNFSKSLGMQAAADSITNPNSIITQLDLHLAIPDRFVENIRKHTIQGKLAYFPMVFRLACNFRPHNPVGYWERYGFGINSFYKSDFDRIGGMNTEKFRYSWGGEDNDLVNRAVASEIEVERMCIRNFFHFYHRRNSVWNQGGKIDFQDKADKVFEANRLW